MMDFELAAKLSGARFVVLQKGLARLERALGQFFLDVHTSEKHGYTEVSPPLLVRDEVMFGTAQLPKFAEDQFQREFTKIDRTIEFVDGLHRRMYARRDLSNRSKAAGEAQDDHQANLDSIKAEICVKRRIAFGSSPPPKCR